MSTAGGRDGEMLIACVILVGISERKLPLGRLMHRWEDNIKMYHKEITREDVQ